MNFFLKSLKPAFASIFIFTILLGIVYPLFMWGFGQIFFHREANGTLFYYEDGKVLGSGLIAQGFTRPEYFHPRPSAAGDKGYDAANSSGSNLSQTSQKLIDTLHQRADKYRSENKLPSKEALPVDAITTSASGLDPHISIENAMLQAPRVAKARGLSLDRVISLIDEYKQEPVLKIFGTKCINVLCINLALDKAEKEERN